MKTTFVAITAFVGILNAPAYAQYKIALYADPAHTSTQVTDHVPGTLTVYVVHESVAGGTAAYFKITPTAGFTGIWVGETTPFLSMGTSQTGIGLSFQPGCIITAQVLEVQYSLLGTSDECSFLEISANPQYDLFAGAAVIVNCVLEEQPALGGRLTINPSPPCSPLPVASTTWGLIKSMYR